MKSKCKFPQKVQTLVLDLTRPLEAADTIRQHLVKTARLDVAVLNAGISQREVFEHTSFEAAQKLMNINFMSNVAIVRVFSSYSDTV